MCKHEWKKFDMIRSYVDWSGFRVYVYNVVCYNCGKGRKKKYY